MQLSNHPTVLRRIAGEENATVVKQKPMDAETLRQVCLDAGADDVGLVSIDRPEIDDQREFILDVFPGAKTLVSFLVRMNPDAIRSTARSVANLEFHHVGDEVNEVGRRIIEALNDHGSRGINPAMGFPMEMERFPGRIQVVSHKPIAEAAGLGVMGIHRNVIHPKFGNFILLGTIITDAVVTEEPRTLDYSPCLECKLCVAACPTGAIKSDGAFDFSACYTHNYREFMGGFTDFVETIADAKNSRDLRKKVTDSESVSWWQSLSFGPNYKAAYCLAVCPAGDDFIGPYLDKRPEFLDEVVRPLQQKKEVIYVMPETDAEAHVARRFPHKEIRRVGQVLRPIDVDSFLSGLSLLFQRDKSKGLDAVYHFTFTGDVERQATVTIRAQELTVSDGHDGKADVRVTADAATWVGFLRRDRNLLWALARGRVRVRGPLALFKRFATCFP